MLIAALEGASRTVPSISGTVASRARPACRCRHAAGAGTAPDSDYRFKHALIQDAAYENLLRSRRQVLHRHVGEILRDQFAGTTAAQPELLARHFTHAGMTEAAIEWWGKAGQRSLERSANAEAIAHFTNGIRVTQALPAGPARDERELALQLALGPALMATGVTALPKSKKRTLARASFVGTSAAGAIYLRRCAVCGSITSSGRE